MGFFMFNIESSVPGSFVSQSDMAPQIAFSWCCIRHNVKHGYDVTISITMFSYLCVYTNK